MRRVSRWRCAKRGWIAELLLWLGGCPLLAQAVPDASVTAGLRNLHARADTAFVGEVVAVHRLGGVVEVEFAVELPVKGELAAHYVLREWGGLWAAGQRRYWLGERALVFLHEPGPTGLSSPVDGMEGVLPVSAGAGADSAEVDVQRLRARVLRSAGMPVAESGARVAVDTLPALLRVRTPKRPVVQPPNRRLAPEDPAQPEKKLPVNDVPVEVVYGIQ